MTPKHLKEPWKWVECLRESITWSPRRKLCFHSVSLGENSGEGFPVGISGPASALWVHVKTGSVSQRKEFKTPVSGGAQQSGLLSKLHQWVFCGAQPCSGCAQLCVSQGGQAYGLSSVPSTFASLFTLTGTQELFPQCLPRCQALF